MRGLHHMHPEASFGRPPPSWYRRTGRRIRNAECPQKTSRAAGPPARPWGCNPAILERQRLGLDGWGTVLLRQKASTAIVDAQLGVESRQLETRMACLAHCSVSCLSLTLLIHHVRARRRAFLPLSPQLAAEMGAAGRAESPRSSSSPLGNFYARAALAQGHRRRRSRPPRPLREVDRRAK